MNDRLQGQPEGVPSGRQRSIAAVGYVFWPFALYGAFVPPSREGRFVRFHARQALVFDLAMTAATAALLLVPFAGPAIAVLVPVPWAALSVMWAVKAYSGERAEMGMVHAAGRRWIER